MASQEAMDKYLNSLNQAMAMHAAAAVQNLKFNKTEIAEIIDNTNSNEGWYVVSNGSFKYNAFSENTTYSIGMQVHVNIPNNDYTGQKTIIGQYKREGEQGVWYRSPWENFSPDANNIILDTLYKDDGQNITDTGELVANWDLTITNSNEIVTEEGPKSQRIVLYRSDSLNDANKIKQRSYQNYKFIGIRANFKTLFSGLDVSSGDYGIRVVLQYDKKDETIEDIKYTYQTVTLNTSDMVGSIYNFNNYYTQEALYELEKDEGASLSAIDIELYQDGNFINKDNQNVDYYYTINNKNYINNPNILMQGLDIRFGNDPIDKDNIIQIYTTNGLTYDSAQKDSLNSKNIYLRWNHLDPTTNIIKKAENTSEVQNFNEIKNYKIHWYKDSIHTANEYLETLNLENETYKEQSELIKKWKNIEGDENASDKDKVSIRKEVIKSFNLDTKLYNADTYAISANGETQINQSLRTSVRSTSKASDVLAGEFWEPIDASGFEISFQPDNNKEISKVMAIVEYGPMEDNIFDTESYEYHMIKSNILEFSNMREIPSDVTSDKFNGLKIYFEDNSDGNYPLYSGTTNEVLNRSDITKTRKLRAEYYSTSNGESYFNGNETIIWQIPVTNTMITMSEEFYNSIEERIFGNDSVFTKYKSIIGDFNANYIYLKRSVKNSSVSVNTTQEYQIGKFYKKSAVNNSVYCYVIKNNQMAKTSATMYFSQHGTSGTDYTFSLGLGSLYEISDAENAEWIEVGPPDTAITLNDEYYREIIFELYDSKNEKIDLTDDQKNDIINSWINLNTNGYYSGLENARVLITNGKNISITIPNIQFKTITNDNKNIRIALRATNSELTALANSYFKSTQSAIKSYSEKCFMIKQEHEHFEPVKEQLKILNEEINKITAERINIPDDDPNKVERLKSLDYLEAEKQQAIDKLTNTEVASHDSYIQELNEQLNLIKRDFDYHWWHYEQAVADYLKPFRYIILKANIWSNVIEENVSSRRIKFEQYLPLHFRAPNSKWCLQGSDVIIYDDKGSNPSCHNDVYKLIDGTTGAAVSMDIIDKIDVKENPDDVDGHNPNAAQTLEIPRVTDYFHIYVNDITNDKLTTEIEDEKTLTKGWDYPSFRTVEDNEGIYLKMVVPSLYLSDQSKKICVEAPGLYTCPLLIIQNKYQIPALNEWDGELLVDGTKNEVLAATIGAGHKNSDNTFTGVAMGDVTHSEGKLTGLFGYDAGARVFELNTDGKAFIGKSGNGRIYVDGNTGRIISAAREDHELKLETAEEKKPDSNKDIEDYTDAENAYDPRGTEINLKENYIDIQGIGNNSRIHISAQPSITKGTGAYFSIDNDQGNRLINVANDNYYLQTNNYNDDNKTGLKIDLKTGIFNSYDQLTIKGGNGSSIEFGDTKNYVKLGINGINAYLEMNKGIGDPATAANNLDSKFEELETAFLNTSVTPLRKTNGRGTSIEYGKLENQESLENDVISVALNSVNNKFGELNSLNSDLEILENQYNDILEQYNQANSIYISNKSDYDNAINIYTKSVDELTDARDAAFAKRNRKEQELEAARANLQDDIDDLNAQIAELEAINQNGDYDETLETLRTNRDNKQSDLDNNTGSLLQPAKDLADAIEDYVEAQSQLDNMASNKAEALTIIVDLGPKVLKAGDETYNEDGILYPLETDGTLFSSVQEYIEQKNTKDTEITAKQEDIDSAYALYVDALSNYNLLNDALSAYTDAYDIYVNNINNQGSGAISLNNTEPIRLKIGSNFSVDENGSIKAFKGTIGGWTIATGQLSSGSTYLYSTDQSTMSKIELNNAVVAEQKNWRIKVSNKFGVDSAGNMYATSGKIGDAVIDKNGIHITGLWINNTKYTPQQITVITGVKLTGQTATRNITYTYTPPPVTTTKWALVESATGVSVTGGPPYYRNEKVSYTEAKSSYNKTASLKMVTSVTLQYTSRKMYVLAPDASSSGWTTNGSFSV